MRRARLPLARRPGEPAAATDRAALGGRSHRPTAHVSCNQRLGKDEVVRSTTLGDVPGAVGRRGLSSQLQSDLRQTQAALCSAGKRAGRTRLILGSDLGRLLVRQASTT